MKHSFLPQLLKRGKAFVSITKLMLKFKSQQKIEGEQSRRANATKLQGLFRAAWRGNRQELHGPGCGALKTHIKKASRPLTTEQK